MEKKEYDIIEHKVILLGEPCKRINLISFISCGKD